MLIVITITENAQLAKMKLLNLQQLLARRYKHITLPPELEYALGKLTTPFRAIVFGDSGNGKSSLVMPLVSALAKNGKVLYVALEEGFEYTTQVNALRALDPKLKGIHFADETTDFDELRERLLDKKRPPKFVIIDSVQYLRKFSLNGYIELKRFKGSIIFISHADGKLPSGAVARRIRYDCGVKIRVEGHVAFITSRYGGKKTFIIWEEGARKYWGKKFRKLQEESRPLVAA